jgi:spore maturation protein A
MMNVIWVLLLSSGIVYAAWQGRIEVVTGSAIAAAEAAVTLALQLTGMMCLWLGLMKIAQEAGLVRGLSWLMGPLVRLIFPSVPRQHPAIGSIMMMWSANMLGLGNAVTPLGIKAMQDLQQLNGRKDTASDAMCTLLALCTAGFTLVPATAIALRSAAGSSEPASIMGATFLVSLLATLVVLVTDRCCRQLYSRWLRR